MKSGHCLIRNKADIKSIDGEFDSKGVLQGPAKIDFYDGTQIHANLVNGVFHGVARIFIDKINQETNLPYPDKHLASLKLFRNAKSIGPVWNFTLNDVAVYQEEEKCQKYVLFIPSEDKT